MKTNLPITKECCDWLNPMLKNVPEASYEQSAVDAVLNHVMKLEEKLASDLMNGDDLCHYLNIKMSRLRSLVFKNEIPVIRIGKVLRYSKKDIAQWLETKKGYEF